MFPPHSIKLIRTDGGNKSFQRLATELEEELKIRDGKDHPFYAELNKTENIKYVILAYENNDAAGCGAISWTNWIAGRNSAVVVRDAWTGADRWRWAIGVGAELLAAGTLSAHL